MIEQIVSTVTETAAQHQLVAYVIAGLMAAAEALPVIGTAVPGTTLIVAVSALVPSGALDIWPLIIATVVGAVAGDGLSFWLGRRFGRDLVALWPLRRHPELVARAEALLLRHGGKSVVFARFFPGLRAFVPLAAGTSGMQSGRFYVFNISSALLWASSHVVVGVALGASLHLVTAIAGRLAVFVVLLAIILWVAVWLARRAILGIGLPALVALQGGMAHWASARNTWPRRQLLGLFHSQWREPRVLLLGAVLLVASLWLFFGILEDLLTGDPLVQANSAVFNFLQSLRTAWGNRLMVAITEMGDGAVTTSVTLAVLSWLLWRRVWRAAAYWLTAVGGAAILTPIIKRSVNWPRPTDLYSGWDAFSFPSGHATINTVLYGFLGFLVARELPPRRRAWVIGAACVLVALISVSRLYLGAHWLADVTAGIAIGTAWVMLLAITYASRQPRGVGAGGLLGVAVLAFAAAWGFHMNRRFQYDMARYAPQKEVRQIALVDWRTGAYRQLPAKRIDLGGETEEPLTLQWVGDLGCLKRQLVRADWQPSVPWTLESTLHWLDTGSAALALPVLPKLQDGLEPVLRLVHSATDPSAGGARLVLLVWPSNVIVTTGATGTSEPLWLGSVVKEHLYRPFGLFTVARALPSVRGARDQLASSLTGESVVARPAGSGDVWDGRLILASCEMPAIRARLTKKPESGVPPFSSEK